MTKAKYKVGDKIQGDWEVQQIHNEWTREAEQGDFYYKRFAEHYNNSLRAKAKFWNIISVKYKIPDKCMLEYLHLNNEFVVKHTSENISEVRERDLTIKTLELEIQILKNRIEEQEKKKVKK